jgi:hypothetical protein
MAIVLNAHEARVLGCLMEKEISTPEYYPLSLNALMHACNQKSNREPVMNLDEAAVSKALRGLNDQMLARSAGGDSRVAKYEHRMADTFNFTRSESAILCELLVRGPQTPGELRSRADRLHPFDDLSAVHSTLKRLMERDSPLVASLPRQAGTKEQRYAHLLCGEMGADSPEATFASEKTSANVGPDASERLVQLETRVDGLQSEIEMLKRQLAEFRKQFD